MRADRERIEFDWDAEEGGWKQDPRCLESSYGNCHGWTPMPCCLKAWVEHGIKLRKGFFQKFQTVSRGSAGCRFRARPIDYWVS